MKKYSFSGNNNKLYPGIIALLFWLVSFKTDSLFFDYSWLTTYSSSSCYELSFMLLAKLTYGLILYGTFYGIQYIISRLVLNDRHIKYALCFFLLYFVVLFFLFLCVYPGIWRLDDIGMLSLVQQGQVWHWHHYLTSFYFMICLMAIPIPAGIPFITCVLASVVAARIVYHVWLLLGESKLAYLAYVPFFLFPVLDGWLFPIRLSFYTLSELFLITEILYLYLSKGPLKPYHALGGALLCALAAVWRTEGIYYLFAAPFVVVLLFGKEHKKILLQFFTSFLAFVILLETPNYAESQRSNNQYNLTGVINPIVPVVGEEYSEKGMSPYLQTINKVLNVTLLREAYDNHSSGINYYWSKNDELIRSSYSNEEYSAFQNSYVHLVFLHPTAFLRERWEELCASVEHMKNSMDLFENTPEFGTDYKFNMPLNSSLRRLVIAILECRKFDDYTTKMPWNNIVYSPILPLFLIILEAAYLLLRRYWKLCCLLLLPAAKGPLVFLTAPSPLFMYYFPVYCTAYLAFALIIIDLLRIKKASTA